MRKLILEFLPIIDNHENIQNKFRFKTEKQFHYICFFNILGISRKKSLNSFLFYFKIIQMSVIKN